MRLMFIPIMVLLPMVIERTSHGGVIYLQAAATTSVRSVIGGKSSEKSETFEKTSPVSRFSANSSNKLDVEDGTVINNYGMQLDLWPDVQLGSSAFGVGVGQFFEFDQVPPGIIASSATSVSGVLRFALTEPLRFSIQGSGRITPVFYNGGIPTDPQVHNAASGLSILDAHDTSVYDFELHEQSLDTTTFDGSSVLNHGGYSLNVSLFDEFTGSATNEGDGRLYQESWFQAAIRFSPVPEPAAWQLLAIGTALVGGLASWRRISRRHRRLRQSLALVLLLAPCGRLVAAEFQPLGDLSGGRYESDAKAVSADGKTVVGVSSSAVGWRAFRWTQAEGLVGLDDMAEAAAVSADGSVIVGGSQRWTATSGVEELKPFQPEGDYIQAFDVSADGAVVAGFGRRTSDPRYEAFRWTEAAGAVGIGMLPGDDYSFAIGISPDGEAIAGSSMDDDDMIEHAFRWTAAGGMVPLGDLNGGTVLSYAGDASADGAIVVGAAGSDYLDPLFGTEAFRWTEAEGMVGLGYLHEHPYSSDAMAVSDDGRIIVGSSYSESDQKAFIWDAKYGMRSLQQVLIGEGVTNLAGWQLNRAWGISADGTVIVGSGYNPEGNTEAWRAVVPEPGSFSIAALAIAGWLFRRPLRCRHGRT